MTQQTRYLVRWPNFAVMLAHLLRRWSNITSALVQGLVFAGKYTAVQSQKAVTAYFNPFTTEARFYVLNAMAFST